MSRDVVLWLMDKVCVLTFHANACWVFNSRLGQHLVRWTFGATETVAR
jgi:hypothetical protein